MTCDQTIDGEYWISTELGRTCDGMRCATCEFQNEYLSRTQKIVESPIRRPLIPITQIQTLLVLSPLAVGFVVLLLFFVVLHSFVYIDCDSITLCGHSVTVMRCRSSHYTRSSFSLYICFYSDATFTLFISVIAAGALQQSHAVALVPVVTIFVIFFFLFASKTIWLKWPENHLCLNSLGSHFFLLLLFLLVSSSFGVRVCVTWLVISLVNDSWSSHSFFHSLCAIPSFSVYCQCSMRLGLLSQVSQIFPCSHYIRIWYRWSAKRRCRFGTAIPQQHRSNYRSLILFTYLLARFFFRLVFFCLLSLLCIYIAIYLIGYLHDDSTPCSGSCCVNVSFQFARALWIRLFSSASLPSPVFRLR